MATDKIIGGCKIYLTIFSKHARSRPPNPRIIQISQKAHSPTKLHGWGILIAFYLQIYCLEQ